MPNLDPLDRAMLADLEEHLKSRFDDTIGFTPRSLLTMARRPAIVLALSDLITAAWRGGTVPVGLKPLLALVSSTAAGCRYCQAHEAVDAAAHGVPPEKVAAIWEFETSELYDDAERAALRLARDASVLPNAVTPAHFSALREHYDDGELVEILSVICIFGFLNRWNDTVATELEDLPRAFAIETLGERGWKPGKHDAGV
jgi:alkylhydroperoxidase family enzyme